jgi:hypothetical protein
LQIPNSEVTKVKKRRAAIRPCEDRKNANKDYKSFERSTGLQIPNSEGRSSGLQIPNSEELQIPNSEGLLMVKNTINGKECE